MNALRRFAGDDRGADLVEYALLVGLVSLGAFAVVGGIGTNIKAMFQTLQQKIAGTTF
jgi:Flp pilus assembly pilin Flp